MLGVLEKAALTAPNQMVHVGGRTLAYRSFGSGPNMVLCVRLRATMDMWDPLFLDKLAENFTVTVFDYSGLGLSTGTPSYAKPAMAKDVNDLVEALGFEKIIIGGWSLGGFAAQTYAATYPDTRAPDVQPALSPAPTPPRRGMFDGLKLSSAPIRMPTQPSPLEQAVQRFGRAAQDIVGMKQQGFEPLPHQREALDSARKEIDALDMWRARAAAEMEPASTMARKRS